MGDDVKRMCKWTRKKLQKDLSTFSEAVKDPQFVCTKCIRIANTKKKLCMPVALTKKSKK